MFQRAAIRYACGTYALIQRFTDGRPEYRQIIGQGTLNPALRQRCDAARGVEMEIGA